MASDHTEFVGRVRPHTRYTPASKFDRRIKSLNRPVPVEELALPPDTPLDEFISKRRAKQD